MWRALRLAGLGAALSAGGCAGLPILNPTSAPAGPPVQARAKGGELERNPLWVPLGPPAYGMVFENVLSVVGEYFEIAHAHRYDGTIVGRARIAPGLGQPWKPGSPSLHERTLASLQTIRHRCEVFLQTADDGGFFIDVRVYKELEDLPRPIRSTGAAAFRGDSTVERQFEVVDPTIVEVNWIPLGRDDTLEQAILRKIKKCM